MGARNDVTGPPMRYAILSDVHSNLEALEAVLIDLDREKPGRILCAGDSVGYGADPGACLRLLRSRDARMVCGNHDLAASGRMDLDWFNPTTQVAVLWTAQQLSEEERGYLGNLPLIWKEEEEIFLAHASLHEPERFHYLFAPADAEPSLNFQDTPVAFIGHTHVPGFFVQEKSQIRFLKGAGLQMKAGQKGLVNVGSVGQPRDGDPRAAWCLYDSGAKTVEIRRVSYPVERAQEKIRKAGLPEFLAERLKHGY